MKFKIYLLIVLFLFIYSFTTIDLKKHKKTVSPLSTKTVIITPTPTPSPTPSPTPTAKPTITPTNTPTAVPTFPPTSLDELFEKYANQYSVAKDLLKRIAICESGLNPNATNLGYGGLFQFSESSWISVRNFMNLDTNASLRFSAEESIKTASFLISRGNADLIWPNCGK
jgi:hypothetical protein